MKIILGTAVWGLALWGALNLANLTVPEEIEHAICGPWGCGPKTMDLAAYHSFQLILVTFPCILAACFLPPRTLRSTGMFLLTVAVLALLGLLMHELVTSWADHREHFAQRYLYRLAIAVDIPVMSTLLAGLFLVCWSQRKEKAVSAVTGE